MIQPALTLPPRFVWQRIGALLASGPARRVLMITLIAMLLAAATVLFAPSKQEQAWEGISLTHVSSRIEANNRKSWLAGFSIAADQKTVHLYLDIKLIPLPGVRRLLLEKNKLVWMEGIDKAWNRHFSLELPDQRQLPIELRVRFTAVNPHHEVVVRPGAGNPDQHDWYMRNPPVIVAHEIGHMLGAYDEYRAGATRPGTSPGYEPSIMSDFSGNGETMPRHLHLVLAKLKQLSGIEQLKIVRTSDQGLQQ